MIIVAKRPYAIAAEILAMQETTDTKLEKGQVRIKNSFCSVKHGTDFLIFSGKSPFAGIYFDTELRMFVDNSEPDAAVFHMPFGNTVVGKVVETGPEVKKIMQLETGCFVTALLAISM